MDDSFETEVSKQQQASVLRRDRSFEELQDLFEVSSMVEHALYEKGKRFIPYEPTFFLYVFFAFNVLYSIDWKSSMEEGVHVKAKGTEQGKIKRFISFFSSDYRFVNEFYQSFKEILTLREKDETMSILEAMNSIVLDNVRVDKAKANDIKARFGRILTEEGFVDKNLKTIATFIYDVRCNIVHGTKSMNHMCDVGQRERIVYYSYFLIALQQMFFMYLEKLDRGNDYYDSNKSFIQRLNGSRRAFLKAHPNLR